MEVVGDSKRTFLPVEMSLKALGILSITFNPGKSSWIAFLNVLTVSDWLLEIFYWCYTGVLLIY